jgi:hypothetical protein
MRRAAGTLTVVVVASALIALGASSALAAVPANDDVGSATAIGGLPFSDSLNTAEATTQADDPLECIGAGHSVWYTFTSAVDVSIGVDTFGSDFDTVLSAYTGSQGSLTEIACRDDSNGLQSHIKWQATAGTVYHVMVSGYGSGSEGDSGNLVLHADVEPAFTFVVSVSGSGSVDETTGVATIGGTVECSIPGTVYSGARYRLRQVVGDAKVRGLLFLSIACGPEPSTWEATASPRDGQFVRGRARIPGTTWTGYSSDFTETQVQTDEARTVRLRR